MPDEELIVETGGPEAIALYRSLVLTVEAQDANYHRLVAERDEARDYGERLYAHVQRLEAWRQHLEAALREGRCRRCGEWFRDSLSTPKEPDNIVATGWMEPFPTTPKDETDD